MKKLFLYSFITWLSPFLSVYGDGPDEPKIEIITTSDHFKPSKLRVEKEAFPDFLKVRVTNVESRSPFMWVNLSIYDTDEKKKLYLDHEKLSHRVAFYLVGKRGNKILTNNASIRLERQEDGSFSNGFDLVIDPEGRRKTLSGDYLCLFQIKLNEEH